MSIDFKDAVVEYLLAGKPARGTQDAYQATIKKWERWGKGKPIEQLRRKEIREFLDWVYEHAVMERGSADKRR